MSAATPLLGILAERTTPGEMAGVLREAFPSHRHMNMTSEDLGDKARVGKLDVLFLPGIVVEDSPYPHLIGPRQRGVIESAMNDGLVVVAECAGMWGALEQFNYASSYKRVEGFRGLGWLKGTGHGPVHLMEDSATRMVRVTYNAKAGQQEVTGVPYHNGPAFFPAAGEEIDVHARFKDVQGQPIAVGGKKMGKGYLAFQSVLLGIRTSHVENFTLTQRRLYPQVARLAEDMKPHEAGREALLQTVLDNLRPRLRSVR